ncbi:Nn.00g043140.m01.CDS01 [Neocucurbitaria sp. VM-36]
MNASDMNEGEQDKRAEIEKLEAKKKEIEKYHEPLRSGPLDDIQAENDKILNKLRAMEEAVMQSRARFERGREDVGAIRKKLDEQFPALITATKVKEDAEAKIDATIATLHKLKEDLHKCTEPLEEVATLFIELANAANLALRDAPGFHPFETDPAVAYEKVQKLVKDHLDALP